MSFNLVEGRRETTAGLWSLHSPSIPVRRSLRLQSGNPGLVDPRRVWTPRIAPSVWRSTVAHRYPGFGWNLFAGGLVSRDVRQDQPCRPEWNGGV